MLLGALVVSLLGDLSGNKGVINAGGGTIKSRFSMSHNPLTNFEIP